MGKSSQEVPETSQELMNAQVAMEQWQMYTEHYRPTEMKFIADVMRDQTGMKQVMSGKVSADVAQRTKMRAIPGVDPSRMATSQAFDSAANVQGKATMTAIQGVDDFKLQNMQNIVNLGMGKAVKAGEGFYSLAKQASKTAMADAAAQQRTGDAYNQAIATGLGGAAAVGNNTWWGSGTMPTDETVSNAWKLLDQKYGL